MTRRFSVCLGVLVWTASAWAGGPKEVTLSWDALAPAITGKKVALVLPDGTSIQGKVRGVDPAGLQIKISKTSDKRGQPKGLHTIPKQSVSVLNVTDYRKLGRVLCTAGTLAALAPILALGASDSSIQEGPAVVVVPSVAVAGTAGLAVGGYYVGKAIDKQITLVRVTP